MNGLIRGGTGKRTSKPPDSSSRVLIAASKYIPTKTLIPTRSPIRFGYLSQFLYIFLSCLDNYSVNMYVHYILVY